MCRVFEIFFVIAIAFVPEIFCGSCREAKLCCPGRDSSCVVQKAPINAIIEDLSDKPCYCDHACLKLGDCCDDFKPACGETRRRNLYDSMRRCKSIYNQSTSQRNDISRFSYQRINEIKFNEVKINGPNFCKKPERKRQCRRNDAPRKINNNVIGVYNAFKSGSVAGTGKNNSRKILTKKIENKSIQLRSFLCWS